VQILAMTGSALLIELLNETIMHGYFAEGFPINLTGVKPLSLDPASGHYKGCKQAQSNIKISGLSVGHVIS
jgi:hypothetical protein